MRVTYWTTACLEPRIEAISKEVDDLAHAFTGSRVFAVSPFLGMTVRERGRVLGFHRAFDPFIRPLIWMLERATDVNHVYADIAPWIIFRSIRVRPTVLTIAEGKADMVTTFLDRSDAIVVQTTETRRALEALGYGPPRVTLIYPGIDLSAFARGPRRRTGDGRTTILLATFPRTVEELEARGINFLLQMAARYDDVDFVFVSRPWARQSTALDEVKARIARDGLSNVRILEGVQTDMASLYGQVDFTVVPFTTPDGGKECPRSLVESLACGVPVLISSRATFSGFVAERACGSVFDLDDTSFGRAIEASLSRYDDQARRATEVAHGHFDVRATFRSYAAIYERLSNNGRAPR